MGNYFDKSSQYTDLLQQLHKVLFTKKNEIFFYTCNRTDSLNKNPKPIYKLSSDYTLSFLLDNNDSPIKMYLDTSRCVYLHGKIIILLMSNDLQLKIEYPDTQYDNIILCNVYVKHEYYWIFKNLVLLNTSDIYITERDSN